MSTIPPKYFSNQNKHTKLPKDMYSLSNRIIHTFNIKKQTKYSLHSRTDRRTHCKGLLYNKNDIQQHE